MAGSLDLDDNGMDTLPAGAARSIGRQMMRQVADPSASHRDAFSSWATEIHSQANPLLMGKGYAQNAGDIDLMIFGT